MRLSPAPDRCSSTSAQTREAAADFLIPLGMPFEKNRPERVTETRFALATDGSSGRPSSLGLRVEMQLKRLLLGRRLATHEQAEQRIGVVAGIPAIGLDGLASSSYGPEAALTILIPLGAAGPAYIGPVALVILALLAILYVSYRQTIAAYPSGGGSYTVAKQNLGTNLGLLAASALLLDYVLNVAVAISAGVAALTSAFPALHKYTLPLCLIVLALVTLTNLRGTAEAGFAFSFPTYLFVGTFAFVIAVGLFKAFRGGGHPEPVVPPPPLPAAVAGLSVWVLMRSFASGCTAMTGVEAVSNGVTAFREPAVKNAQRTLTGIVTILAALLAGIAYLSRAYGIGAMHQTQSHYQSVLSQLVGAVMGRGVVYYVAMGSLLAVLALSANTSFVGFPRLCRLIAADNFLPHAFAIVGRRLVYSVGIVFLTCTAGALLIAFGGITDRLIPLFAVGAFAAFTLSQAGMVVHWRRELKRAGGDASQRSRNRIRLGVNALGALATGVALVIILLAKFREGAWITLIGVPVLLTVFKMVKRHYLRAARQIRTHEPLELDLPGPPVIVVPTEGWNKLTEKSLDLAVRLSPDVTAVHLSALNGDDERTDEKLRRQWAEEVVDPVRKAGLTPPRLEIIHSPYRKFLDPLLAHVEKVKREFPTRQIAVIVPEVVKRHWWQYLLHQYRAERLRSALLQSGDKRTVLINVPWYLDD
jgi:amino acid transporter